MSNSFFQFKKFNINQDKCAMKVCTDACLFGAWVAANIENENFEDILDIGAGTGLLSLALAQKIPASFDAIELNADAAVQAEENFSASPWAGRLKVFNDNIFNFNPGKQYDFIISNPPFFENDLKSDDDNRNAAMHSTALNLENLLFHIKRLLSGGGKAAVLIPFNRSRYFEKLILQNGFYIEDLMHVKQSVDHDFFRSQYIFSSDATGETGRSEMAIYDSERQYTPGFTALLKDYYLKL